MIKERLITSVVAGIVAFIAFLYFHISLSIALPLSILVLLIILLIGDKEFWEKRRRENERRRIEHIENKNIRRQAYHHELGRRLAQERYENDRLDREESTRQFRNVRKSIFGS